MSLDSFLTRCRWASAVEHSKFITLTTDNIKYVFHRPLEPQEQEHLLDFLHDENTMQSLSVLDISNFFVNENIPFHLAPTICTKKTIKNHLQRWYLLWRCNNHLKNKEEWNYWYGQIQASMHNLHTNMWIGCLGICCSKPFTAEMEDTLQILCQGGASLNHMANIFIYLENHDYHPRFQFQLNWSEGPIYMYKQFNAYRKLKKWAMKRRS